MASRLVRTVAIVAAVGVTSLVGSLPRGASGASNDSISFEAIGYDRQAIDREASNYCGTHGKTAAFTGQSGSRLSYDCVSSSGNADAPVAATPAVTDVPVAAAGYGNGHDNPSVSYDATRYDRQAIVAAANSYCGTQGMSAAFSGRSDSLVNYDCIPYADAGRSPVAAPSAPAVPSATFEFTGDNQLTIEAEAAKYCTGKGGAAVFRSQDGTRVTYDCVIGASLPDTTTSSLDSSASPKGVPTITYSMTGNSQQNIDAPAIRYCAMLGKSPVLGGESGSSRTYECR